MCQPMNQMQCRAKLNWKPQPALGNLCKLYVNVPNLLVEPKMASHDEHAEAPLMYILG